MLRVIRATAARSSRTSFSFSSTRSLSMAAVQPSPARDPDAFLLRTFFFLRKFSSSHSNGSASEVSSSSKPERNGESVHDSSCFSLSKEHLESLRTPKLTCDSKDEASSVYGSGNTSGEEASLEMNPEAERDEALDFDGNVAPLTDDSESAMSAGQESDALSASESVYEDADDEGGDLSAAKDFDSNTGVESEEDSTVDMSKVPEDLKEMMDDSYVCESVEEDYLPDGPLELLTLDEVNQVLEEVRARDVKIFSVHDRCEWTDVMVIATGISDRHVRGIADALVYKIKKKSIVDSPFYPTIEGQFGGKWLVVDCGNIVIHVLNEESRAYYRLEELWTGDVKPSTTDEDFETMLNRAGIKDAVP